MRPHGTKGSYREPYVAHRLERIVCDGCGLAKDVGPTEGDYELWYETDFKGHALWARNEQHARALIEWLSSGRSATGTPFEALPQWMVTDRVKVVAKLRKLLGSALLGVLLLVLAWPRAGQAAGDGSEHETPIPLTVIDVPFDTKGWPSMMQSLDLGYAVMRLPTWGIVRGLDRMRNPSLRIGLRLMAVYAVDAPLVLVAGWTHEEWHRAVMTHRGIDSRNGIYHPSAWSNGLIAVDHVTDEDLARLKAEHPADTVRLMMAGLEAQDALARRIGDHSFLYGDRGVWRGPLYMGQELMFAALQVNFMSALLYYGQCAGPSSDRVTDAENRGTLPVLSRDFTGLDCNAFVYDLHRPDEPYADRGLHPYGAGVDRYRSWEDLDGRERGFMRRQLGLHFLDLLDPRLYAIDGFRWVGRRGMYGDRWIARAGHSLAPFGYSVDAEVGLRRRRLAGLFGLRNGINGQRWFPTATARVLEVGPRRVPLSLDLEADAWLQPDRLRYDERRARPGGRLAATVHWRALPGASFDLTLDGKSAGYVPGNVYLERNLSLRLGATLRL